MSLRVYRITAYVVFAPFLFLVTWLFVSPVIEFSAASVVLPNGMVLKHRFNLNRGARDDLFAAGGRTRVARDIGLVCFNDRYLLTTTLYGNSPTLFDGKTGRRVDDADYDAALAASDSGGGVALPATAITRSWSKLATFSTPRVSCLACGAIRRTSPFATALGSTGPVIDPNSSPRCWRERAASRVLNSGLSDFGSGLCLASL